MCLGEAGTGLRMREDARARARACVCVTLELTDFGVALASSLEAVAEDGFQLRAQARDPAK